MAAIQDHGYLTACAKLASSLSISQSAAKRKVELAGRSKGIKDALGLKEIAEDLLKDSLLVNEKRKMIKPSQLDQLLVAAPHEENFMVED